MLIFFVLPLQMSRITFYLILLSIIIALYVFMTKDKYLKTKVKHENFEAKDDEEVEEKTINDETEEEDSNEKKVKVPKKKAKISDVSDKSTDEKLDKIMDMLTKNTLTIDELTTNVKDLATRSKAKQEPNYMWY